MDLDNRWLTSAVLDLMAAYDASKGDWSILGILADALSDAGCDNGLVEMMQWMWTYKRLPQLTHSGKFRFYFPLHEYAKFGSDEFEFEESEHWLWIGIQDVLDVLGNTPSACVIACLPWWDNQGVPERCLSVFGVIDAEETQTSRERQGIPDFSPQARPGSERGT